MCYFLRRVIWDYYGIYRECPYTDCTYFLVRPLAFSLLAIARVHIHTHTKQWTAFVPLGSSWGFLYIKAADDVLFLSRVTISVRSAASLHHARLRFKRSILCWKGEGVWEDTLTRQRGRGYIHIIIEFLLDSIKSTRTTDVYFYLFAILSS